MKLVIEVSHVEGSVYEAALSRGEPELGIGGAITVKCRDFGAEKSSAKLMELLRTLGWKGSFEVNYSVEYPPIEEKEEESVYIFSRSRDIQHKVTYKEDRDPRYECTCEDFIYNKKSNDEWCWHITEAVNEYDLGLL